jgi:hypothetical protein
MGGPGGAPPVISGGLEVTGGALAGTGLQVLRAGAR